MRAPRQLGGQADVPVSMLAYTCTRVHMYTCTIVLQYVRTMVLEYIHMYTCTVVHVYGHVTALHVPYLFRDVCVCASAARLGI
jgi:hypothetical protein